MKLLLRPKYKNLTTKLVIFLILIFCQIGFEEAFSASSEIQNEKISNSNVQILGSYIEENGERKILLGAKFKIEKDWKIYGEGSEGIGLPPSFDFKGSSNYKKHQIFFPNAIPAEEKIGDQTYKYSYYKDEVVIPITYEVIDSKQPTDIKISVNYALCKDVCIPASHEFSIRIDELVDCEAIKTIRKYIPKTNSGMENDFEKIDLTLGSSEPNKPTIHRIFLMIIVAIFGGAILNIMPCVLPVLSIKLISLINHSGASVKKIRLSFFSTILGILVCFLALSLIAFSIKKTGNSLGWGFQFQNPYFLISLILILVFFVADLIGIFEINFNQFLATLLNNKISRNEKKGHIFTPNFFSGVLAVVLATPCSAPFLGSAISFALTQNFALILIIFLAIGVGFALPYIILIISPKLIKILPKPGSWMLKTKQLMAGFLIATVVWLIFVLTNIIGILPSLLVTILSVTIFGAMKIKSKILRVFAILFIIISSLTLPLNIHKKQLESKAKFEANWQVFDESILHRLISENRIVLVDITADWCITCKFNKIMVLQSKEITELLTNGKIIGLRADITKPDDAVMQFLKKNNRFAIPFNAVYGPNAREGLLTSELLRKKDLIDLIEQAK